MQLDDLKLKAKVGSRRQAVRETLEHARIICQL